MFALTQDYRQSFRFAELEIDQTIQFNDSLYIIPYSDEIVTAGQILIRDTDYRFNYADRRLRFLKERTLSDSLIVRFHLLNLKRRYALNEEPAIFTAQAADTTISTYPFLKTTDKKSSSAFSNLISSGSIYRGFRITSNQDLKLESGLNLNLEGNLSEDVTIRAAITDEATPIQPEGSTQNLSEIDKIYINVSSPDFDATVGDFDYTLRQNNLLDYNRRLNGMNIIYKNDRLQLGGIVSSSRSQYHRNLLLTREGLQGPYKLSSPSNNLDILVIAGSEKVYLDGQLQQRGSNNDYIIEYADGTIRFTNKRIIRANQRLEVEFEYVEALQRFGRNVYQAESSYQSNRFTSRFVFLREQDDIADPISSESALTAEEREILRSAGNDQLKASQSSIILSTNGNTGLYDKIFNNTINDSVLIYRADRQGRYNASFANVGINKGSYKRVSRFNNQYEYVGPLQADYEAIRFIPIPEEESVILNLSTFNYAESDQLTVATALSINDQNVLSELDDRFRDGFYLDLDNLNQFKGVFGIKEITLRTGLNYRSRYFHSLGRNQRINQFSEYGFNQDDIVAYQRQFSEEVNFNGESNRNQLRFDGIQYGDDLLALKLNTDHLLKNSSADRSLQLQSSFLDTRNDNRNYFQRYKSGLAKFSQDFAIIKLETSYELKRRDIQDQQLNGIQEQEFSIRLSHSDELFESIAYQFTKSAEQLRDTTAETSFLDFAGQTEHSFSASIGSESVHNALKFSLRDRDIDAFFLGLTDQKKRYFNSAFTDSTYSNNRSILIENNFRYAAYQRAMNINFNYRTGSELTAKQELVYEQVSPGFGNYRKEGDQYIPDSKGDYIRFVLPSNEFEPVTKINVLLQLRFDPSLYPFEQAFYKQFLNNFSFNSSLNLLEESRADDRTKLYLLYPSALLGDQSANASLQFYQYIYYRANNPDFNAELSYQNNQHVINTFVNDVSGENNRSRSYDWQIKLNYRFVENLRLSSSYRLSKQNKRVSSDSTFNRLIRINELKQSITWFPITSLSISDEIIFANESNDIPDTYIKINRISNSNSINYRISDKGSIQGKIEFSQVNEVDNPNQIALPYEMANGRQIGINKEWEINAIYRLSDNLNIDFNYSGRKNALDSELINIMRMELRLLF